MEFFEREYQDSSSDFDDRIDGDEHHYWMKNDDSEVQMEEDRFYRHLDEY
jgi:hypothetical protein